MLVGGRFVLWWEWCDGLRAGGCVCDRMADEAYGQVEPKELTAEEQSVLREVFDKFDEV